MRLPIIRAMSGKRINTPMILATVFYFIFLFLVFKLLSVLPLGPDLRPLIPIFYILLTVVYVIFVFYI